MDNFHPTVIDLFVLAALLISGFFGYWRGLIKEIFAIAGWLAATFAIFFGFTALQPVTRDFIHNPAIADFATGTLLFAGTLIVVSVITHFLSKWVKGSAFGAADRSLGFIFGLIRGLLIIALVFFVYSSAEPDPDQYPESLQKSISLPYLQQGTDWLINFIQNNALDDMENSDENAKLIIKDTVKERESEYKEIEKEGLQPPGP